MKHSIKILLIVLAATMVVSFGIAAAILAVTGNFSVASESIYETRTFDASEISSINIDLASDDLNVIPADGDEITVKYYGRVSTNVKRNIPELVAYKTGDRLYVEVENSNQIFIGVNIRNTAMDIYIPEIALEQMDIKVVSGNITIKGLDASQLNVKSTSGDISAEDLLAENLHIESTSGNISVTEYTGAVEISSTSGDIKLITSKENGDISMNVISGNIYIEQDSVSGMDIKATSGDVKLILPQDAKFYIDAKATSGDIKQNFDMKVKASGRSDLEAEIGGGGERITIRTVSGNITVDY